MCFMYISKQLNFAQDFFRFICIIIYALLACIHNTRVVSSTPYQIRSGNNCYCFFAKNRKVRMSTILISLFKRNMDICVVKILCGQWPEVPSKDRYLKLFLMTIYYERKNIDVPDVIKKSILTFLVLDYLRYCTL